MTTTKEQLGKSDTGTDTVLCVVKWSEVFETADSRKHKKLNWVSIPLDNDSSGFLSLVEEFGDDAAAIYGCWIALVKIAGKAPKRGYLCNGKGIPYSTAHLSRLSHFPKHLFDKLLTFCLKPEIRWLVYDQPPIDCESSYLTLPNKPNTTNPTTGDCGGDVGGGLDFSGLDRDAVQRNLRRFWNLSNLPKNQRNITMAMQVSVIAKQFDDMEFLRSVASQIGSGEVRRTKGFVDGAIRNFCQRRELDVDAVLKACGDWVEKQKG